MRFWFGQQLPSLLQPIGRRKSTSVTHVVNGPDAGRSSDRAEPGWRKDLPCRNFSKGELPNFTFRLESVDLLDIKEVANSQFKRYNCSHLLTTL